MAKTEVIMPDSDVTRKPVKKTKPTNSKPKTHKTLEGEELWRVATANGVSVRELAERNELSDLSVVAEGTIIQLP
ncbi:LysM peptidoglycan-binding domain-containing protein [Lactiplantibacillus nangangensis]|uniref:LysM peptidoglycan-binding domain-containing protein n=1 Tax=Lactiplantibacillus nangangensis TaxID=2559917 RepID=A0ABW1SLH8_9LACO|nr:LysM domain-containing protein [Lactiplantibacillus nangangensis]